MSGAGRGTPRISPAFSSDPLPANIDPGTGAINSIVSHGNGRWTYHLTIDLAPLVLTGNFVQPAGFGIPPGGVRGLAIANYVPADATSQLDAQIKINGNLSILSISDTTNATFPDAGLAIGGNLPIYTPTYRTPAAAGSRTLGIPFCVPAGGFDTIALAYREIGTVGGSVDLTDIYIDNFGC